MPEFQFEAKGLAELEKVLNDLPLKLEKNIIRGALRAAAKPVVAEAKRLVPVLAIPDARRLAGALRDSIRVRGVNYRRGRLTGGIVAGGSNKKSGVDTFYARFVEFGTVKMAPHPFLRAAAYGMTAEETEAFATYISGRLDREIGVGK